MNIEEKLQQLDGWKYNREKKTLYKEFHFKSYLKNISFVNAIAYLANKLNHHPDLVIKYNLCLVEITTHDEAGLTEKDFQLASQIDLL